MKKRTKQTINWASCSLYDYELLKHVYKYRDILQYTYVFTKQEDDTVIAIILR